MRTAPFISSLCSSAAGVLIGVCVYGFLTSRDRSARNGNDLGPAYEESVSQTAVIRVAPAGGLQGSISREELYKALLFLEPRWKIAKTNNLLHALRLWGVDADFTNSPLPNPFLTVPPSGKRMLDVLLSNRLFRQAGIFPSECLYRTDHGVGVVRDNINAGGVAHVDQYMKVMAESGVPLRTKIEVFEKDDATLADVLRESQYSFGLEEELEFSAVAFSRYLPPRTTWQNRFGEVFTFDMMADKLLEKSLGQGACGGVHAMYALINLLRVNDRYPILKPVTRERIERRIARVSRLLEANQSPDGAWYLDWHVGKVPSEDEPVGFQAVWMTGHHLEWIALAVPRLRPDRKVIQKAASYLVKAIPLHTIHTIAESYAPFSHAGRALALIEEVDPAQVIKAGDPTKP
jgi:hypothetical protein